MIRLTLVVALFISAFAEDRIKPTTIEAFPWQISLQRNASHSCGGSIYSSKIIVTAAHCLQSVSPSVLRVRAGSSYWNSGGVVVNVAAFKEHPGYNKATNDNDIAIVLLSSSLDTSNSIKPIGLATSSPITGTNAVVTGWGNSLLGIPIASNILQELTVEIVSRSDQCASTSCTYGSLIKPSLTCQGGSGGPLVADGSLIGVVSRGVGCSGLLSRGIFTDVAYLRSWIEDEAQLLEEEFSV